jgi:hypothetical protein
MGSRRLMVMQDRSKRKLGQRLLVLVQKQQGGVMT